MIKLILIQTENSFELFMSIEKAFDYCKKIKNIKRIDLVDVDERKIYYGERNENGALNYVDEVGLIKQGIISDIY